MPTLNTIIDNTLNVVITNMIAIQFAESRYRDYDDNELYIGTALQQIINKLSRTYGFTY